MVPKLSPRWACGARPAVGLVALMASTSLGAGCTSLLGVDGDYQGNGGGPGSGGASSTSSPAVDASSSASTSGGGGAGEGGAPPFTGLEPCGEALAIDPPVGTLRHVLGVPDVRAPRARMEAGKLSVAWVQGSSPGAAFGFIERDGSIRASSNDCTSAVPFDDGIHRLAGVTTAGDLVASPLEDVDTASNVSELELLRDARQTSNGGTFLVKYESAWALHEATLDAATFQVVATIPVDCASAAQVVDAALVNEGSVVAKVCADGSVEHPLGIEQAVGPRAIAAAEHEETIYTAYRDASGIRIVRGIHDVGEPTTTILAEAPPYPAPELDAVSVAAVPGGALIAWSRDDTPTVTSLAAAFCPPSGPCCEVGVEAAIDQEVAQAPELAATQRVAPSLASMPDGSDLALAYAHRPAAGGESEIVAMRLVIAMP